MAVLANCAHTRQRIMPGQSVWTCIDCDRVLVAPTAPPCPRKTPLFTPPYMSYRVEYAATRFSATPAMAGTIGWAPLSTLNEAFGLHTTREAAETFLDERCQSLGTSRGDYRVTEIIIDPLACSCHTARKCPQHHVDYFYPVYQFPGADEVEL